MSYKRTIIELKKDNMRSSTGVHPWSSIIFININDMLDSLSHLTPSLFADDTEI